MADPRTALLARELHVLHDLTHTEAVVAKVRTLQARDAGTKQELADNAADARDRAASIGAALSALGTPPDVAAPIVGTAMALLRAQSDALRSPSGALLADLALENSLLSHSRFARQVAEGLGNDDVVALTDRLEASHTETVGWVEERLAEVAAGTASAVRPLPPQLLVAAAQGAIFLPLQLAGSILARLRPGRPATPSPTVEVAPAAAPEDVVDRTDPPNEHDLPIKEYHRLAGDTVMRRVADMDSPAEVSQVLAFEQANKARPGVVDALQSRLDDLTATATA